MSARIAFFLIIVSLVQASLFHHDFDKASYWEESGLEPFDELIVSWEAKRPRHGCFVIQVSLLTTEWSPWIDYAVWKAADQASFDTTTDEIKDFQDTLEITKGQKAKGFRIQVEAFGGARLSDMRTLHASTADLASYQMDFAVDHQLSLALEVPKMSQKKLSKEIGHRLCSPTSVLAVARFLEPSIAIDPLLFAKKVHDSTFDIYGNWPLNTAEASNRLGRACHVCVTRLSGFQPILDSLEKGLPVVVSLKGPLPGGFSEYASGHLLVVRGYDPYQKCVLCMDPAFETDDQTYVSYPLQDFLKAWEKRQGAAYLFYR